jgi:CBS domain-containing protein
VQSGTTIGEAIRRMQQHTGDNLLVMSDERLVGVLTERDIVHRVLARGVDPDALVDVFMDRDPATLPPDAPLVQALELLARRGDRTVGLVDADDRPATRSQPSRNLGTRCTGLGA